MVHQSTRDERIKARAFLQALAPQGKRIDERFFEPRTETSLGGFVGFGIVDLERFI